MLTSSISDEALQIYSSELNEGGIVNPKPRIMGTFENLVSSQKDVHSRYEDRSRGGDEEENEENFTAVTQRTESCAIEYDRAFKNSLENPEEFWAEIGHELSWFKPWDKVIDNTNPPFTKWFVGGMLNACYNAVDRHVENGHGKRVALIHDSPVTSTIRYITYSQLFDKVSRLAGVYSSIGVKKGDRVLIYMPMIPEAIISMLAAARLGAIHSVVFGGFAARELRTRIEHAEPTVIVAASCGVEPNKIVRYRCILQEALSCSKFKPTHVIMFERPEIPLDNSKRERKYFGEVIECDWEESLQTATPHDCVPVEANDPLYILYTSGTTDQPKGVVRPVGGHLATLSWTMHAVYGMKPPKESLTSECNGEASGEYKSNPSGKYEHTCSTRETATKFDSRKQKENNSKKNSSINENDITNDVSTSKIIEKCNLVNGETSEVKSEQVTSTTEVGGYVESMEKEDDVYFLQKANKEDEHNKTDRDFSVKIPSKSTSDSILSKVCLKMRQLLTGTKDRKANQSISCNHINLHESSDGMMSNEIKISPTCSSNKILESINHTSPDGLLTAGEYENENLLKITACNLKDSGCKIIGADNSATKSLKVLSATSNCLVRNADLKSTHFTSEFSQTVWEPKQAEVFPNHTGYMSNQFTNHYPNHLQVGKRKCDLNVDPREKFEQSNKMKSKNLHPTTGNSHQLPRCKSKIKSLSDESQYNQNKVWWAASDMGWVVGHSYVCYAPLTAGLTSVMYEGKPDRTPDPGQYFRVIEQHKVNAILTAPTALRVIKRVDPCAIYGKQYSTDSLETIFVAGENLDQSTKSWAEKTFKVDVVNHWWQTETGHSITATCIGLGHSSNHPPGLSTGKPFPGFDLHILRDDGSEAAVGEEGRIAARLPLPPGTLSSLYKNPEMFKSLYFSTYPGYYDTMDAGYILPDSNSSSGWIVVTGREDDVVSVAGHRLSASALEAVALQHPDVSDALVVGAPDRTKGEVPLCLYVPSKDWKKGAEEDNDAAQRISSDLVCMVRELVGPIAAFRLASPVPALPKTRSGKIPRKSVARMARGLPLKIPSTIEDPLVYEDIKSVLQRMRFYE